MTAQGSRTGNLLRGAGGALFDLAFPPRCNACDSTLSTPTTHGFCVACCSDLPVIAEPVCARCALPLLSPIYPNQHACPHCQAESWAFDQTIALGAYEGLLRHLVLRAKRTSGEQGARSLGRLLSEVRGDRLRSVHSGHVIVSPIPSHWTRRWAGRSDSPDWIAQEVARGLGLHPRQLLRRVRRTERQTETPPSRRAANVRKAFRVIDPERARGATVLLVDDVLTTGATASSAARELIRGGAERVVAIVAARRTGRG